MPTPTPTADAAPLCIADALKRIEYAAVSSIGLLRILEDIDLPGWHSQIVEKCDLLIDAMSALIVLQDLEKEIHL